ncbi:MAG: hypothetical protein ABJA80_04435 [bacterium]
MTSAEIESARSDVERSRVQVTETLAELEERVTAPVAAVRERLDVGALVQGHPWTSLAVAMSAGALVAATGADERVAVAAARAAHDASHATLDAARSAPSKTMGAVSAAADAIAVKLALAFIRSITAAEPGAPPPVRRQPVAGSQPGT